MVVRGVAFVGCYLPRACGIATFTYDLAEATARIAEPPQTTAVVAMTNGDNQYAYPPRVLREIRQERIADYERAAHFLNTLPIDIVSIQHEYGIFGGESGSHILALLERLERPAVITCHTVRKQPTPVQREIMLEMASRARRLVVMSRLGKEYLAAFYRIPAEKIALIPHGIHEVPLRGSTSRGGGLGFSGRVLLTFGLLHENKGIEYMIDAMPAILARHPRTTYVVLGITHPNVAMQEGEGYRRSLERQVRKLGLERRIRFVPRFVDLKQLLEYLSATDIFVTPYLNEEYITSGALAYAVGSGTAVVSTPYWYACELLDEGRGCIVPMRDSGALAREIIRLLDDERALGAMQRKAYAYSRPMVWTTVARSYQRLFGAITGAAARRSPLPDTAPRDFASGTFPGK